MADDIVQSTSPVVRQPVPLGRDALQEADAELLKLLNEAPARPKRGRPVGSRNKPKASGVVGSGGREDAKTDKEGKPDLSEVARLKIAKTEAYTAQIVQGFNDQILMVLVSVGVPPQALFLDGKGPKPQNFRNDLTAVGNRVAIQPSQAHAIASFLTELEFTDTGSRLAKSVGSGNGAMALKGLLAFAATVQYLQGLNSFRKEIEPLLQQLRQQQGQTTSNGQAPTPPPPTPGEQMRTRLG
jgi:hypothetical protein